MAELTDAGCVAFSQADAPLTDTQLLLRALQYAATFGFTVWLRPQDAASRDGGVAHDGEVATRLGLPAIPVAPRPSRCRTILLLARETGARVHLCRLSSAEGGARWCATRKRAGSPVTCDVAIHHAHLSGNGHRLLRRQLPSDAAAAQPARPRRAARRASPTAPSTRSAPTTRRSTTTPSSCRSPRPKPAPPALELLLPLALKWAEEAKHAAGAGAGAHHRRPGARARHRGRPLAVGAHAPTSASSIPRATGRSSRQALKSQGKNTPFTRLRTAGQGALHPGRRPARLRRLVPGRAVEAKTNRR